MRGFVLGEFSELGKIFRTSGVAKGDADVAKKSLKLDAFDGRFGKNLSEVFHRQVEKVAQGMSEDLLPGVEGSLPRGLGKAIPRAGIEAIVTSVDAVAHGPAEFERNGPFVFNGEV